MTNKDYNKSYYLQHRQQIIDRVKKYYDANKEQILSKRRKGRPISRVQQIINNGGHYDCFTIIKDAIQNNKKVLLCKCDCGKEFFTTKQHITQNISKNRIITCNECAKKRQKAIAGKIGKINEIYLRQTAEKLKIEQSRVDKLCRVKKYKNNTTTEYAGIRIHQNSYEVTLGVNGKQHYIGRCKTLNDAIKMRQNAIEKYHRPLIHKFFEGVKK